MTFDMERLVRVCHGLNLWRDDQCDHSMRKYHPSGRVPGYEDACRLDARFITESYAVLPPTEANMAAATAAGD